MGNWPSSEGSQKLNQCRFPPFCFFQKWTKQCEIFWSKCVFSTGILMNVMFLTSTQSWFWRSVSSRRSFVIYWLDGRFWAFMTGDKISVWFLLEFDISNQRKPKDIKEPIVIQSKSAFSWGALRNLKIECRKVFDTSVAEKYHTGTISGACGISALNMAAQYWVIAHAWPDRQTFNSARIRGANSGNRSSEREQEESHDRYPRNKSSREEEDEGDINCTPLFGGDTCSKRAALPTDTGRFGRIDRLWIRTSCKEELSFFTFPIPIETGRHNGMF